MLQVRQLQTDPEVNTLIVHADRNMEIMGYTKHGARHALQVARTARRVLAQLGFDSRSTCLASLAGYLHDIGNAISRTNHAQTGALLAGQILSRLGMPSPDFAEVVAAIGNHHEEDGGPVSPISAALILADKSDVHRYRVRSPEALKQDIHDRVNFAVTKSGLIVSRPRRTITFNLTIDTTISSVMDYFEIFLSRMLISRRAAAFLDCQFSLFLNQTRMV
ncbi:MAG: HD domain-containing protein [candidate division WOR-3 bacterium]